MASPRPIEDVIVACYIVARDNTLLFSKSYCETDIGLELACYAALDAVEERVGDKGGDPFVNILLTHELQKVFGYVPSTGIRLFLITRELPLRESALRALLAEVHRVYADTISNPFCAPDAPITSERFKKRLDDLFTKAVQTLEYVPTPSG